MARALAAIAIAWPLFAAVAVAQEIRAPGGMLSTAVYVVSSQICHQRSERSFHTEEVQWPVCSRCSGLYVGAAIGALLSRSSAIARRIARVRPPILLAVAAAPTTLAWMAEWALGADVTNTLRGGTALPLGATIALVLVAVVSKSSESNQVN